MEKPFSPIPDTAASGSDTPHTAQRSEFGALDLAILSASPDNITIIDLTGAIRLISPAGLEMFGYKQPRELLGRSVLEFIVPEDRERAAENMAQMLRSGASPGTGEYRAIRGDGTAIHIESNTEFIRDGSGQTTGIVLVVRDITERKLTLERLLESENTLQSVLDALTSHVALLDEDGTIMLVNRAWRAFAHANGLHSDSASEGANYLCACTTAAGNNSEEATPFGNGIRRVLAGAADIFEMEYPCHSQNEFRWFIGRVTPFPGTGCRRAVVAHENITARKRAEAFGKYRSAILEQLAKGAPLVAILEAIVRGIEQLHRPLICSILLLDSTGRHLHNGAAPSLPDFYNSAIDGVEIGMGVGSCGTAAFTGERVVVADIASHPYWKNFKELAARAGLGACWSQPIISSTGQVLGTFALYHATAHTPREDDITLIEQSAQLASIAIERRRIEEALIESHRKLASLSITDDLTQLANRRQFDLVLQNEYERHVRSGGMLTLIMLDIDHFKSYNDIYGHVSGDECLRRIAGVLAGTVARAADLAARYGGEEFACILPETCGAGAASVAETIRSGIQALAMPHQGSPPLNLVTASLGVLTTCCNSDGSVSDIVSRADALLYRAKASGRNTVAASGGIAGPAGG